MVTRLKTITYSSSNESYFSNNNTVSLADLLLTIPETIIGFKSVTLKLVGTDSIGATGGSLANRTISVGLNSGTKTTFANANILTNSGENIDIKLCYNITNLFTTSWSGSTSTINCDILFYQSTGSGSGLNQIAYIVEITYQYDDTSATQIKTVMIPLNAPVGALPIISSTTNDIITSINSYFPESNKVFKDIFITLIYNDHGGTTTAMSNVYLRLNSDTVTLNISKALATNRFHTNYIKTVNFLNTPTQWNSDLEVEVYSDTASHNHMQMYATFTYTYDEVNTSRVFNSLLLPMDVDSPLGSTTVNDYQKATRDLWIQEPGTITTSRIAYFVYLAQPLNISTLNLRIGSGSFITYTDNLSVIAGMNCAMVRNDSAFTLVRGKNTFNFDAYTSGTTLGTNISGFWLINYISDKHSLGTGVHNKTVRFNIFDFSLTAVEATKISSNFNATIPETNYFINAIGTDLTFQSSTVNTPNGFTIQVQRLAGEGGLVWETAYKDISQTDSEVGVYYTYSQIRWLMKRFPTDDYSNRIDVTTARRWKYHAPLPVTTLGSGWASLDLVMTYHSITYPITGAVTGLSGPITVSLIREQNSEKIGEITLSDNSSYSFTWYDNTDPIFTTAKDSTKLIRSVTNIADNIFDLKPGISNDSPTYYAD